MERIINTLREFFAELRNDACVYPEMQTVRRELDRQLESIARCPALSSSVFRKHAVMRLRDERDRLEQLGAGRLIFDSTETWRTVYEEILNACKAKRYLSVAVVRSDDYWRDKPGERSLEFNFQLVNHGFHVHRIFVIDDFFWPRAARTPSTILFHWIHSQRLRGIEVSMVRITELEHEPTLVRDMGIYGTDAVGYQQTDFEGRTTRFEVTFDAADMKDAEQRWEQLLLYAKPYDDVVVVN